MAWRWASWKFRGLERRPFESGPSLAPVSPRQVTQQMAKSGSASLLAPAAAGDSAARDPRPGRSPRSPARPRRRLKRPSASTRIRVSCFAARGVPAFRPADLPMRRRAEYWEQSGFQSLVSGPGHHESRAKSAVATRREPCPRFWGEIELAKRSAGSAALSRFAPVSAGRNRSPALERDPLSHRVRQRGHRFGPIGMAALGCRIPPTLGRSELSC